MPLDSNPSELRPTHDEVRAYSKGPLITTAIGIPVLFVFLGVFGTLYEKEIVILTQKIADLFGFGGLWSLVVF
ncbi:MAG: hypothetical protein KDD22_02540, partial [Bdellovibrionales bacterium]|nr:hypothetical protein [Bdellovibrionales bacterium]